jgi:general secretion pathway protein C
LPEPSPATNRRRALIALGVIGALGFGGGALANVAVARLLALPDGAEVPAYADAEAADGAGASGVGADRGEAVADSKTEARPRQRALPEKTYADIIVRRNIFDSSAVYDPNAAKATDPAGECRSDANVRLLATVVAEVPTYSSALISLGAARDAKADGYAMGDEVSGEGRIVLIEQKKVCMDGGTCICIGTDAAKPATASSTAKGDGEGGVKKLSDNKYAVDSSLIEDSMNNFESLAGQMRVAPHKGADGQVDGYRLSAIRRGSLFDKLGIKNGDIVHTVNGNALTSTEAAMQVYQSLRNERSFNFEITRRNQRQTLEYEVR